MSPAVLKQKQLSNFTISINLVFQGNFISHTFYSHRITSMFKEYQLYNKPQAQSMKNVLIPVEIV